MRVSGLRSTLFRGWLQGFDTFVSKKWTALPGEPGLVGAMGATMLRKMSPRDLIQSERQLAEGKSADKERGSRWHACGLKTWPPRFCGLSVTGG